MMLLVRRSTILAAAAAHTLPATSQSRQAMGTVAKGTTRTAVHGLRSPATTTLENKEEVEAAIDKGREQKQKTRELVEGTVDFNISSADSAADRRSTTK